MTSSNIYDWTSTSSEVAHINLQDALSASKIVVPNSGGSRHDVPEILGVLSSMTKENILVNEETHEPYKHSQIGKSAHELAAMSVSSASAAEASLASSVASLSGSSVEVSSASLSHQPDISNFGSQQQPQQQPGLDISSQQQPPGLVAPENVSWYYLDPQNQEQGPFSGSTMQQWYSGGYLSADLQIRRANELVRYPLSRLTSQVGMMQFPFVPPSSSKNLFMANPQWGWSRGFNGITGSMGGNINGVMGGMNGGINVGQFNSIGGFNGEAMGINAVQFGGIGMNGGINGGFNGSMPMNGGINSAMNSGINGGLNSGLSTNINSSVGNSLSSSLNMKNGLESNLNSALNSPSISMPEMGVVNDMSLSLGLNGSTLLDNHGNEVISNAEVDKLSSLLLSSVLDEERELESEKRMREEKIKQEAEEKVRLEKEKEEQEKLEKERVKQEKEREKKEKQERKEKLRLEKERIKQEKREKREREKGKEKEHRREKKEYIPLNDVLKSMGESLSPEKPSSPETPAALSNLAPWASKVVEVPAKLSLKKIQELEAAERIKENEKKQQQSLQERNTLFSAALKEEETVAKKLPNTAGWAAMVSQPVKPAKTLLDIQREEAAEKKKKQEASTAASSLTAASLAASYAKQDDSWTVVSSNAKKAAAAIPKSVAKPKNVSTPAQLRQVSAASHVSTGRSESSSSSNKTNNSKHRREMLAWCRSELKDLNRGVNKEELLRMFFQFPCSLDSRDLIQDTIYSSSKTINGRRFADEFIKRRKAVEKYVSNWDEALEMNPDNEEDEWVMSTKKKRK